MPLKVYITPGNDSQDKIQTRIYVYETLCPQQMITKHLSYCENGCLTGGGGLVSSKVWGRGGVG